MLIHATVTHIQYLFKMFQLFCAALIQWQCLLKKSFKTMIFVTVLLDRSRAQVLGIVTVLSFRGAGIIQGRCL